MRKTLLVIRREYAVRIRKTSFWILAVLVPLVVAVLYALPVLLASHDESHAVVLVVDESGIFQSQFQSAKDITYRDAGSLTYAEQQMKSDDSVSAILYIPARETTIPSDAYLYYAADAPSMELRSNVDNQLQTIMRNTILQDVHGISSDDYYQLTHTNILLRMRDIESGRDDFLEVKTVVGIVFALLIVFVVVMFGSQVMRGVMEEKNNRIVEVLLGSVRPFQMMMGKVVGIGLVGLTQFVIWVGLSSVAIFGVRTLYADAFTQVEVQLQARQVASKGLEATAQLDASLATPPQSELLEGLVSIDFTLILLVFLIYFFVGYLLYASFFAAAGALSDIDTDSQQFTLPLTVPLLLALLCVPSMIASPSGSLATWLSLIPFTSPVAMMVRLPFGVSIAQVWISVTLLVVSVPLSVWFASRVYKASILLNGRVKKNRFR